MANIPFALYLLTSESSGPSHSVKTGEDEGWVLGWAQTTAPEDGGEGPRGEPASMVPHHCEQPHVQRGAVE